MARKIRERIAKLRKEKGMTQVEFSEKLGIQRIAVTRIENGKINLSILNLRKLAISLNLELYELLCFSPS